jgi:hypothetical protein
MSDPACKCGHPFAGHKNGKRPRDPLRCVLCRCSRFELPGTWRFRGRTYKGKPWYGPKKLSRFWFSEPGRREMLQRKLSFKVGDLANDCDYFNHRITKIEPQYSFVYKWKGIRKSHRNRRARFLYDVTLWKPSYFVQFHDSRENDHCFCGCNASPDYPWKRDDIEKALWDTLDYHREQVDEGSATWYDDQQRMHATLASGGHVCDVDGIMLPEFRTERKT